MQRTSASASAAAVARRIAVVGIALVLLLLGALHLLSPEFDPSWRVVSEYANGRFGWVLTMMFVCWAISSWALAFSLRPYLHTLAGKIGVWMLVIVGVGQALAAIFDINQPLHGLADLLGAGGFPIAAILISTAIHRYNKPLMWTAILSAVTLVLMIASVLTLFVTYTHAGGQVPADGRPLPIGTMLPRGAIAVDGYVNRLLIVNYCTWGLIAALKTTVISSRSGAKEAPASASASFLLG